MEPENPPVWKRKIIWFSNLHDFEFHVFTLTGCSPNLDTSHKFIKWFRSKKSQKLSQPLDAVPTLRHYDLYGPQSSWIKPIAPLGYPTNSLTVSAPFPDSSFSWYTTSKSNPKFAPFARKWETLWWIAPSQSETSRSSVKQDGCVWDGHQSLLHLSKEIERI